MIEEKTRETEEFAICDGSDERNSDTNDICFSSIDPKTGKPFSTRAWRKLDHKTKKKNLRWRDRRNKHLLMLEEAKQVQKIVEDRVGVLKQESLYSELKSETDHEILFSDDEELRELLRKERQDGTLEGLEEEVASLVFRSSDIVDAVLTRPQKYNEKYASQEIAIAFHVFSLMMGKGESKNSLIVPDVLIDIGAGNANLAILLMILLDIPKVICVEMKSPRDELRGEILLPDFFRDRVERVESLIQEWSLPSEMQNAIVIGKHLCGFGTDAAIQFVQEACEKKSCAVLGCLFATCCFCKISAADAEHFQARYEINGEEEIEVVRKEEKAWEKNDEEQFDKECPLQGANTDSDQWFCRGKQMRVQELRKKCNFIRLRKTEDCDFLPVNEEFPKKYKKMGDLIPAIAKFTSWRSTSSAVSSVLTDEMLNLAEYFESFFQQFRIGKLGEIFATGEREGSKTAVKEVLYCKEEVHSQQNRLLVAGRSLEEMGEKSPSEERDLSAFDHLRLAFLRKISVSIKKHGSLLPIDIRPEGMISKRFEWDGMKMVHLTS